MDWRQGISIWRWADNFLLEKGQQIDQRVDELRRVIASLQHMSDNDPMWPLQRKLDFSRLTAIGHSQGGATVLTAALVGDIQISGMLLLDPAMDWLPQYIKSRLMSTSTNLDRTFMQRKFGWQSFAKSKELDLPTTFKGEIPTEFVWSEAFSKKTAQNSMGSAAWDMEVSLDRIGLRASTHILRNTVHIHFTDAPMLLPKWLPLYLPRLLGQASSRQPSDVMAEINAISLRFLSSTD